MNTATAPTFHTRKAEGEIFSERVFRALRDWGFSVALNGTEHTHPDFVKLLHRSNDETSLRVRYQPDGVIAIGETPRSAYVEAKRSIFIEKDAYIQYLRLAEQGCIVAVVFEDKKNGEIKWNFVEQLRFDLSEKYRSKYQWPIVDGWICPRASIHHAEAKRNGYGGSTTPYRALDWASLYEWRTFRQMMVWRMSLQFPTA